MHVSPTRDKEKFLEVVLIDLFSDLSFQNGGLRVIGGIRHVAIHMAGKAQLERMQDDELHRCNKFLSSKRRRKGNRGRTRHRAKRLGSVASSS